LGLCTARLKRPLTALARTFEINQFLPKRELMFSRE
jgi:hypothetical protein